MNATPSFGVSMISEVPSNPQLTLAVKFDSLPCLKRSMIIDILFLECSFFHFTKKTLLNNLQKSNLEEDGKEGQKTLLPLAS